MPLDDLPQIRTPEQIREQYRVEKELAGRLKSASREERWTLYPSVYDEFYRRFPHLVSARRISPSLKASALRLQFAMLKPYLRPNSVFLEIGPGDCSFAIEVSKFVERVFAVDTSEEITSNLLTPRNFSLLLAKGSDIPVEPGTVDIAYSTDFIEHLHPDDALEHLEKVLLILRPGGHYLCSTPSRLSGPHDISAGFDLVANGLHLKEYGVSDLSRIFRHAGFRHVRQRVGFRSRFGEFLPAPAAFCEFLLGFLPANWIRPLASRTPLRQLLAVNLIGRK